MNKIISIQKSIQIAKKFRNEEKTIVLAGGCFDILHMGHIKFLENSKKSGDVLFVLLESDKNVKKLKGNKRPLNNQKNRAIVISALSCVDFVIMLTDLKTDNEYDNVVKKIHPSIITTTYEDPNIIHKKRQAKLINGKVVSVVKRIPDFSTSKTANLSEKKAL